MLVLVAGTALSQPPAPLLTFGRGEIVSAAWAPDGQSVWIGTTAGTWQLDANLQEIAAHPHITYAALSPDGTKLAGAALGGEVGVGIWFQAMQSG
ncbi:MAG: PD40 domain-containing protein [Chloroflexi bacterium]|nr:PD40 domain-containing protein [Chloroflexota bacterium]